MKTIEQLNQELDEKIPRSAVSERQGGGGRSLSYLAGHYVIDRLNKVFGPLNWASQTTMLQLVSTSATSVHYIAQVRLVVEGPDGKKTEHTCTGYGDGTDKANIGKAHELAVKEAETDALKRCAKNLGQSMGLALYDKEQPNVEDGAPAKQPEAPPAPRPSAEGQHASRGQGAPQERPKGGTNREQLNKSITSYSKVVLAKAKDEDRPKIIADMKADMAAKYGSDDKEKLTDAQAEELLAALKQRASG